MIRTITAEELVEADIMLESVVDHVLFRPLDAHLLGEMAVRLRQASHDAYIERKVRERWEWEVFPDPNDLNAVVARPTKIGNDTIDWDGAYSALAMINREVGPAFQHDCTNCTYLGQYAAHDLYHCTQGGFMPTLIARWGSDGPEYTSGPTLKLGLAFHLNLDQVKELLT